MQQNLTKDIIEEIGKLVDEKIHLSIYYYLEYLKSYKNVSSEKRILLKKEFNKYKESYKEYKKVLNFLLFNERKIFFEDGLSTLEIMDQIFTDVIDYIFRLIEMFETSRVLNLDYKFYIPSKQPRYILNYDRIDYINYAKGFNEDRVCYFLNDNQVYDMNLYNAVMDEAKLIHCSEDDYNAYARVDHNGQITMPYIKDEISTLVGIKQLIKKKLIIDKDTINDDRIIRGEYLPRLYELLFIDYNSFCKHKIHMDNVTKKLYEDYDNEPYNIQIDKLKRILK